MKQELEKWIPIIKMAGIKNNIEPIAEFCELQSNNQLNIVTTLGIEDNLLPINLRILSMLNLDDIQVVNSTGIKPVVLYMKTTGIQYHDSSESEKHKMIAEHVSTYINDKLVGKSRLCVDGLVQHIIMTPDVITMAPVFRIRLGVSFE